MWWRRRPKDGLGAPPAPRTLARDLAVMAMADFFLFTLPLFALSLMVVWLIDRVSHKLSAV